MRLLRVVRKKCDKTVDGGRKQDAGHSRVIEDGKLRAYTRAKLTWITLATQPAWYTNLSVSTATCYLFGSARSRNLASDENAPTG